MLADLLFYYCVIVATHRQFQGINVNINGIIKLHNN